MTEKRHWWYDDRELRPTHPAATGRSAGPADTYRSARPVEILGQSGIAILALAGVVGAALATVALWPYGAALWILALPTAALAGFYCYHELAETRDRYRYNRDRRENLIWALEAAVDRDIDGDGVVGRPALARPLLVRGAALDVADVLKKHPVEAGPTNPQRSIDAALDRLFDAIQEARGQLSWSALEGPLDGDRELYDWGLHSETGVLPVLGVVAGRKPGAAGELLFDLPEARRLTHYMWNEVAGNGAKLTRVGNAT